MKGLSLEYNYNELNVIEYAVYRFENSILEYNPLIEFDMFIIYIDGLL